MITRLIGVAALALLWCAGPGLAAEKTTIKGRVEIDGKPAEGVEVSYGQVKTMSNKEGVFTLELPQLQIDQMETLKAVSRDKRYGASLILAKGKEPKLRLQPITDVTLQVKDNKGKPVAGVQVYINPGPLFSPTFGYAMMQTNTRGECLLKGLQDKGKYEVMWYPRERGGSPEVLQGSRQFTAAARKPWTIEVKYFEVPRGAAAVSPDTRCGQLENFCLNAKDQLLACDSQNQKIRVISLDDKLVADWKLDFGPQAVACREDGSVVVAGSGKIALLDSSGNKVLEAALPEKAATASAVSACGKDIYVCVRSKTSFEIYRLTDKLTEPKLLVQNLRGCCGQMDFKVRNDVLYVASNCEFLVKRYDREGKPLGSFGKRDDGTDASFKGCCEPKNISFDKAGNLYVSESSQCCVKKFTPEGKLLCYVGRVLTINGCVRVTTAEPSNGKGLYMIDTTHNLICPVLPGKGDGTPPGGACK